MASRQGDIAKEPGLALNLYLRWSSASDDSLITQFGQQALLKLQSRAEERNLTYPFVYLNDAGAGQDPFALYGGGRSLPRMRAVRQTYDPSGVFQDLQPGGFKIGV